MLNTLLTEPNETFMHNKQKIDAMVMKRLPVELIAKLSDEEILAELMKVRVEFRQQYEALGEYANVPMHEWVAFIDYFGSEEMERLLVPILKETANPKQIKSPADLLEHVQRLADLTVPYMAKLAAFVEQTTATKH